MSDQRASSMRSWHVDLIGVGVIGLMSGTAWFLGVQPLLEEHHEHSVIIGVIQERTNEDELLRRSLQDMALELDLVRERVDAEVMPLAAPEHLNDRIADLTARAESFSLEVHAITPEDPTVTDHYRLYPVRVEGAGNFRNCARFIHGVYETMPDATIRSFDLSEDAPTDAVGMFTVDLVLYTASDGA